MKTPSKYTSKTPDTNGFVDYSSEENAVWAELYERQWKIIQNRACDEYIQGIQALEMTQDKVPQIPDINKKLKALTDWSVAPVAALINFERFFELLANKQFPAATFIRVKEDLDYIQEPDIFHEIFGHCPMLTVQPFADFMHEYGKLGLKASPKERVMLARLYWFTVEFGLINAAQGLRIYGGGILSSIGETPYSLENNQVARKPLDIIDAFRTPYRIDIMQTVYFVINSFEELYGLMQQDLLNLIKEAQALGMHEPTFPPKEEQQEGDEFKVC